MVDKPSLHLEHRTQLLLKSNIMVILKNQYIRVMISPFGAELQELQHIERGHIIWKKDDTIWNRYAPILFPIVSGLCPHRRYFDHSTSEVAMVIEG